MPKEWVYAHGGRQNSRTHSMRFSAMHGRWVRGRKLWEERLKTCEDDRVQKDRGQAFLAQ